MTDMLTTHKRDAALQLANTIRLRNAETKARIATFPLPEGCRVVADMLQEDTGPAESIQVGQLVDSIHRVGPHVSGALLCRAGIYRHAKQVGDLTARQRTALARLLREKADQHVPKVPR